MGSSPEPGVPTLKPSDQALATKPYTFQNPNCASWEVLCVQSIPATGYISGGSEDLGRWDRVSYRHGYTISSNEYGCGDGVDEQRLPCKV